MTTLTQRLAQLEADLSPGNRVVRISEIWSRDSKGEPNLVRYADVQTGDLLMLLRERRELLARVAELEEQLAEPLPSRTMTVRELLDALKGFHDEATVTFDTGERPDSIYSWRGDYSELALGHECDGRTTSVSELRTWLTGAIGKVFTGYKGGNYLMYEDTYVWCDNYGECTSRMIVGVRERDGNVVLVTRVED